MKIYKNVAELVGHTPLLEAGRTEREEQTKARLLLKVESFNPAGSVKDRPARQMIAEAEESGRLKPGGTIIEPTSGNTGMGLAALAALDLLEEMMLAEFPLGVYRDKDQEV